MDTIDPTLATYLQGPRLQLRAIEPEDLDVVYEMENAAESWDVAHYSIPYSRYAIRQYIASARHDLYADLQVRLVVTLRHNRRAIGAIDLTDFSPQHSRAELGVAILPAYRGQGYGRESVGIMCRYAFGPLHLHQIIAYAATHHAASLHVLQANGFEECGRLRQWWRTPGGYRDVVMLQCMNPNPPSEP